jgi:hypothetical protein
VLLDDAELLDVEATGLVQDEVGDADLADVVQVPGEMDHPRHAGGQPHGQGQDLAHPGHLLGVGAGPQGLGRHGPAQRLGELVDRDEQVGLDLRLENAVRRKIHDQPSPEQPQRGPAAWVPAP